VRELVAAHNIACGVDVLDVDAEVVVNRNAAFGEL
jgi:hypothetical protein